MIAVPVHFQEGQVGKATTHTLVMVSHTLKAYTAIFSGSLLYRVVFLTGPPLKMSLDWPPLKMPGLAPP